jgi:hypothetical protein
MAMEIFPGHCSVNKKDGLNLRKYQSWYAQSRLSVGSICRYGFTKAKDFFCGSRIIFFL